MNYEIYRVKEEMLEIHVIGGLPVTGTPVGSRTAIISNIIFSPLRCNFMLKLPFKSQHSESQELFQ